MRIAAEVDATSTYIFSNTYRATPTAKICSFFFHYLVSLKFNTIRSSHEITSQNQLPACYFPEWIKSLSQAWLFLDQYRETCAIFHPLEELEPRYLFYLIRRWSCLLTTLSKGEKTVGMHADWDLISWISMIDG